jgi:hypothetical protein
MNQSDTEKMLKELLDLYEDIRLGNQIPANTDIVMFLILLQLTRIADTHEKFYQIIKDIARRPA